MQGWDGITRISQIEISGNRCRYGKSGGGNVELTNT